MEEHEADFCVVGGGMAGTVAAIAAARHGARTILMHDRPVLGGNASSECRVHICGADRSNGIKHMRETGILEELRLENARRNPHTEYSLWDALLYEKTQFQENLQVLYNCSCLDADTGGGRVSSVTGWQTTTQLYHRVKARIFADCSGDAILAPLTNAEFRVGREARAEYDESIAPEEADERTMGMTCLFQAREHDTPQPFDPPFWANRYDSEDDLPYGAKGHGWWRMGYWWVELGGEDDSIRDTERLRDELLKITLGVWDHIKNRGDHGADNWALEWIQFLPGKRESRRYVGAHVLTQNDVEAEGKFDDMVAYGGWTMDDHHPTGFRSAKIGAPATIFHEAPSPFGIPYRSLYSRNVDNLMFAGRCASATHAAMSSTRVMGTGCSMGQAMGTAAAIAVREGVDPAGVGHRIEELQQTLLRDDCYLLPWIPRETGPLTRDAKLSSSKGDPEPLRDGIARQVGDDPHAWTASPGDWAAYEFGGSKRVEEVTLVLDSGMDRMIQMGRHRKDMTSLEVPDVCVKAFRVEGLERGEWKTLHQAADNHQRLVRLRIGRNVEGVRLMLGNTWGAPESRVYAMYVDGGNG